MHELRPRIVGTSICAIGMATVMAYLVVWGYAPDDSLKWKHGWPLVWQVRYRYISAAAPYNTSPLSSPFPFVDEAPALPTRWDFLLVDVLIAGIVTANIAVAVYRVMRAFRLRPQFSIGAAVAVTGWTAMVVGLMKDEHLALERLCYALALVIMYLALGVCWVQGVGAARMLLSRLSFAPNSPPDETQSAVQVESATTAEARALVGPRLRLALKRTTKLALVAALVVVLLIGVWSGRHSAGVGAARPDVNLPRALSALALTQQHGRYSVYDDYWDDGRTRFEQMYKDIEASLAPDLEWQSYFVPHVDLAPGQPPSQIAPDDARAIADLLQGGGVENEVFSADGRHYVRAVRLDRNCVDCHTTGMFGTASTNQAYADAYAGELIGFHVVRLRRKSR